MKTRDTAESPRARVYTLDEVEAVLKLGRTKIRQLVKDGRLRSIHVDRRVLVRDEDIEEFLAQDR